MCAKLRAHARNQPGDSPCDKLNAPDLRTPVKQTKECQNRTSKIKHVITQDDGVKTSIMFLLLKTKEQRECVI